MVDVVIAGAGPDGLMLACELGGRRCLSAHRASAPTRTDVSDIQNGGWVSADAQIVREVLRDDRLRTIKPRDRSPFRLARWILAKTDPDVPNPIEPPAPLVSDPLCTPGFGARSRGHSRRAPSTDFARVSMSAPTHRSPAPSMRRTVNRSRFGWAARRHRSWLCLLHCLLAGPPVVGLAGGTAFDGGPEHNRLRQLVTRQCLCSVVD